MSHNITQVDNVVSVLADLQKRVRNLETASPTSLIVTDLNGIKRAEFGYDPATIPGGYGGVVRNSSGNDIWDTTGLVGVSTVLAYSGGLSLSGGTATTTMTTMGGSTMSFTVGGSRAVNVLCISTIYLTCNNSSGASWLYAKFGAATALSTATAQIPPTGTTSTSVENLMRFVYLTSIAPGTYSTFWENWTNAGTCAWGGTTSGETLVLQLGS